MGKSLQAADMHLSKEYDSHMLRQLIAACAVCFAAATAHADLLLKTPAHACSALAEHGFKTGAYGDRGGGEYWCSTPYRDIGQRSADALPNNVAYYVVGTAGSVKRLRLVLNVNQPGAAKPAHDALLKATSVLAPKAVGGDLDRKVSSAIIEGRSISQRVGTSQITVLRDNWPTGRGYEIRVTFE